MFSSNTTQVSGSGPVYVEDVFSTYLYTGNGTTQGINNGIQLGAGATSPGWIASLGGASSDSGYSIAVDSSGNVYVCGSTGASGTNDIQIAKYNTSGVIQWQRSLGGASSDIGYSIAVDSSGNVYVCGSTDASGTNDFLFAKLPGDGSGVGAYTIRSATYNYVASSLTDAVSTLTDAASSLTDAASSLTDAASTLTDAASTLTSSTTPLAEGPGQGGLIWNKQRNGTFTHCLTDTARGVGNSLDSADTAANDYSITRISSFNANGFTMGGNSRTNANTSTYSSWTFRKQAKFFDVVTFTWNATVTRNISHSLQSIPGTVIIKKTNGIESWYIVHRSAANFFDFTTSAAQGGGTFANGIGSSSTNSWIGATTTTFDPSNFCTGAGTNTYVAYLFAHDAGGFGAAGTDNVISCGSYVGSGTATGPEISLGYEPQFVIIKRSAGGNSNWHMFDNMRGVSTGGNDAYLAANLADAETATSNLLSFTAVGFQPTSTAASINDNNSTYIYIAIRRGPMKTPTSGTSVFGLSARTGTGANATVTGGQTDDAILVKNRGSAVGDLLSARLIGTGYQETSSTAIEVAAGTTILQANPWDVMDGVKLGTTSTITNASANTFINYLFRRAPGFFDVVCYTGTGSATTVSHNLGVAPELMIVKVRSGSASWSVYSSSTGGANALLLNTNGASSSSPATWNSTAPTSSVFSVGAATGTNSSGATYVAYLFATVAGVSKVGSYTGTAALQTINCGFTSGARFVLIKRTDSTGDWYVWDSARGISSGNDPYLLLNSTAAEVTGTNYVDTDSTGFQVTAAAPAGINASGGSYLFWAVS